MSKMKRLQVDVLPILVLLVLSCCVLEATGQANGTEAASICPSRDSNYTYTNRDGQISTPGFFTDSGYPGTQHCFWTVAADGAVQYELSVALFDMEESEDCLFDFVQFYTDGVEFGKRFCGTNTFEYKSVFLVDATTISIEFKSDDSINGQGVLVYYKSYTADRVQGRGESESYECGDGQIIPVNNKCDGVEHCLNLKDESEEAGCEGFTCSDKEGRKRIPSALVCDGDRDCSDNPDSSDELDCEGVFMCDDGKLIPNVWKCDQVCDCSKGEDEDETPEGGVCERNVCIKDECINGYLHIANRTCMCDAGWDGDYCQIDLINNCNDSPCRNGTCYDAVDGYTCACVDGFMGSDCDIDVGVHPNNTMYVDNINGQDSDLCGLKEDPCRTLHYSMARCKKGTFVLLVYSEQAYEMADYYWLTDDLSIIGLESESEEYPTVNMKVVVTSKYRSFIKPTLVIRRLIIRDSDLLAGNGIIDISDCEIRFTTFRQEQMTGESSANLVYKIQDSQVYDTQILTRPLQRDDTFPSLDNLELSLLRSEFENCLINATADRMKVTMLNIRMSTRKYLLSSGSAGIQKRATTPLTSTVSGIHFHTGFINKFLDTSSQVSSGSKSGKGSGVVTTTTVVTRKEDVLITIQDSDFSGLAVNMPGQLDSDSRGVVTLVSERSFTFNIRDSNFTDNENRAIEVDFVYGDESSIYITRCNFHNNVALGPGGAIFIHSAGQSSKTKIHESTFTNNLALASANVTEEVEDEASGDVTGNGGAIAGLLESNIHGYRMDIELQDCHFINNTAQTYGGTLYFSPKILVKFIRNDFSNIVDPNGVRPRIGDIMESRANMILEGNTFRVMTSKNTVPIVSYRAATDGSFMETNELILQCPKGHNSEKVYSAIPVSKTRMPLETLNLYCLSCDDGQYSTSQSEMHMTQDGGLQINQTADTCRKCPYGAVCKPAQGVTSKTNFWGEIDPADSNILMHQCPPRYCCQKNTCPSIAECNEFRVGPLCGACQEGYSLSIFSDMCVPNDECTAASWIWVPVVLFGIGYIFLFLFQDEWRFLLHYFHDWFRRLFIKIKSKLPKRNEPSAKKRRAHQNWEEEKKEEGRGAYMQIFMYYMQVPSLLRVSLLYLNDRGRPLAVLSENIEAIFNFNIFGEFMTLCLFVDLDAVMKIGLKSLYILCLFVVLLIFYLLTLAAKPCLAKLNPNFIYSPTYTRRTIPAKYLVTLISLFLFTYQYFAENSLALLNCKDLRSIKEGSVLFVDGTQICYSAWQYVIMVFVGVYIFPFSCTMIFGPPLVKYEMISVRTFILAMLFPLVLVPYLFYKFMKLRKEGKEKHRPIPKTPHEKVGMAGSVSEVLCDPYRTDALKGISWEGIVVLRRLILVVINTFTKTALVRHVLLTVMCFIISVSHNAIQPYTLRNCNNLETASLYVLLGISIMNLLKSVYFDQGVIPQASADTLFLYYDWVEAIVIFITPLLIIGVLVLAIIIRLLGQCFSACCGSMDVPQETQWAHQGATWQSREPVPEDYYVKSDERGNIVHPGNGEMRSQYPPPPELRFEGRGEMPRPPPGLSRNQHYDFQRRL